MAQITVCDGCGEANSEMTVRGPLLREYCQSCCLIVIDYEAERDALHDKVKATWDNGLKKIRAKFAFKDGLLSDE